MLILLSVFRNSLRARAQLAGRALRSEAGEISFAQIIAEIIAGILLITAIWVFRDEFGSLFQWIVNSVLDAVSDAFGNNDTKNQQPFDGAGHRESVQPSDHGGTLSDGKTEK